MAILFQSHSGRKKGEGPLTTLAAPPAMPPSGLAAGIFFFFLKKFVARSTRAFVDKIFASFRGREMAIPA